MCGVRVGSDSIFSQVARIVPVVERSLLPQRRPASAGSVLGLCPGVLGQCAALSGSGAPWGGRPGVLFECRAPLPLFLSGAPAGCVSPVAVKSPPQRSVLLFPGSSAVLLLTRSPLSCVYLALERIRLALIAVGAAFTPTGALKWIALPSAGF